MNVLVTILIVLVSIAITSLFLFTIHIGEMDWFGRTGSSNPYEKHPFWWLGIGYWVFVLGCFAIQKALSTWEGVVFLSAIGIAFCIWLDRYRY